MRPPTTIRFSALLQRKDPRLPVFLVVPHAVVAPWGLRGTTVVEGDMNGHAIGRRSIKRWDASPDADWFVELAAPFCKAAGIAVGDALTVALSRASEEVPAELEALLADAPSLRDAWNRVSDAKRRATMEHIRAAKSAATRASRASTAVRALQAAG